jgi:hypothetical protein
LPIGPLFPLGSFLKITALAHVFGQPFFLGKSTVLPNFDQQWVGLQFGQCFADSSGHPGADVLMFKIFSPENSAKKLAFLAQNKAKLCKILIITLVFDKNANFFAENRQKSQKIVIITSTPCRH